MEQLHEGRCIPCEGGVPPANEAEIMTYLAQLPDWEILEMDQVKHLTKSFIFDNFVHALAFTNSVGQLAEQAGHHPVLVTEWGKVTTTWWTHSIGGLHKNDFIMAAQTEESFRKAEGAQ